MWTEAAIAFLGPGGIVENHEITQIIWYPVRDSNWSSASHKSDVLGLPPDQTCSVRRNISLEPTRTKFSRNPTDYFGGETCRQTDGQHLLLKL
jgi:hypothetical protein